MKRKLITHVSTIIVFAIFLLTIWSYTASGEQEEMSYVIRATGITVPRNKIILIRKGNELGAFKFNNYYEKQAEYEWFFPLQFGLNDTKFKVKSGKGKLNDRLFTIFGRLSFQLGNTKIKCGPLRLYWTGNNMVSFYDGSSQEWESVMELAPTNKEHIEDINLKSTNLQWYKYDEKRSDITVPLNLLTSTVSTR